LLEETSRPSDSILWKQDGRNLNFANTSLGACESMGLPDSSGNNRN